MLEKRYVLGLFLSVFLFGLALDASANHYAITDASFASSAGTSFVVGTTATSITVTLNITNTTSLEGETADYDDVRNVTVTVAATNGSLIQLGINDSILTNVAGNEGNSTYAVEIPLSFSQSNINEMVVPANGVTTLNITFDIFNLTDDGDFNESIGDTDQSFTFFVRGPEVTIKFLDINNKEKTTFPATDKVKIVCTRSSPYSTISFNDTNISISVPGGNTFDSLESSTFRASASTDFEVEFTRTRELGDYTVACLSIDDNAFLNDTTNATFTIVKKIPKGSSPFVNPNFKPPVATVLVGSGSVSSLGTLTEEGSSRLIAKTGAVSFALGETTYTLTAKDITDTTTTFAVEGANSFDVTVNAKESKNVDVSGDGADDITIVLHQVFNKRADTTFKLLTAQQAPPSQQEEQKEEVKQPTTTTISSGWGLVVVIFLVVLFILGALHYFSARRRGGNNTSNASVRFTPRDMGMQRPPGEPRTFTRY